MWSLHNDSYFLSHFFQFCINLLHFQNTFLNFSTNSWFHFLWFQVFFLRPSLKMLPHWTFYIVGLPFYFDQVLFNRKYPISLEEEKPLYFLKLLFFLYILINLGIFHRLSLFLSTAKYFFMVLRLFCCFCNLIIFEILRF